MIKGVLLDLSGVIYDGARPIVGSVDAVRRLRDMGVRLRLISNTTRSTRASIVERLDSLGLSVAESELLTPARAARDWLDRHGCSPYLLVHPAVAPEFTGLAGRERRCVVVGDVGESLDYAALNKAFRELTAGAEFVALANNRIFKDTDGELSLDAGPFVAALEFATRRQAVVLGKPSPDFFLSALVGMDCAPEEAVMVGDDAEADIAGALSSGLAFALLVRTGKYRAGDEALFDPRPTATVDDLAAAAEWIMAHLKQP